MRTQRLAVLSLASLVVALLAGTTPARADDTAFSQALAALVRALDTAACGADRKCAGAFRKARASFGAAERALAAEDLKRLVASVVKGAAVLEKAGHVPAELPALVAVSDEGVGGLRESAVAALRELCPSARCRARDSLAAPDADRSAAHEAAAAGQWSLALRYSGAAALAYSAAADNAGELSASCGPPACRSSEFVHFTPGNGESIELLPPDAGSSACFAVDIHPLDGELCTTYTGGGHSELWGTLGARGIEIDIVGGASVAACTDSAGWARVARVGFSATLSGEDIGRQRASASVTAKPPTVSFFGGLLPNAPSALRLRVGDRMVERNVALKLSPMKATQVCDSVTHEVVAIETLRVEAGSFRTARIRSFGDCQVRVRDESEDVSFEATTWVASEVGQVLIDTDSARYELVSFSLPEGCSLE